VGLRRKGETEPLAEPYIHAKKGGGTNHYFGAYSCSSWLRAA
jgi:hypothetical protein